MKRQVRTFNVKGHSFSVWSDFIMRATYAENENGVTKQLSGGGYISAERTIKNAIKRVFNL